MDALAGYGSNSDSDSSFRIEHPPLPAPDATTGLSGLLGCGSDDDDDDDRHNGEAANGRDGDEVVGRGEGMDALPPPEPNGKGGEDDDDDGGGASGGMERKRRRRRWDDPVGRVEGGASPLPPPELSTIDVDRTARLREGLSRQARAQRENSSSMAGGEPTSVDDERRRRRVGEKLDRLHDQFQGRRGGGGVEGSSSAASASSFSAHLKSQREFGNPHLLETIIDHFRIRPLESHAGNSFKGFEYADRLMAAEERARVAAANYDARMAEGAEGTPGHRA